MKKQFIILLIVLLIFQALPILAKNLDEGLKSLVNQLNVGIMAQSKNKVAVADFSNLEGVTSDFGKYIAEDLSTLMAKTQMLNVIERRLLLKVLQEQTFQLSSVIDENTAKQFGKILGADVIITGTFTDLVNIVKINARAINTQTGQVITAATTEVTVDENVKILLKRESSLPPVQTVPKPQPTPQSPKPASLPVEPKTGGIIFKEDFSKYEVGDPLPSLGEGLIVLKMDDGRKCVTTQMTGVHVVKLALNFPPDFTVEMEFIGRHSRGGESGNGVDPTFTNSDGEPFKINLWGNAPTFQLPGNKYVNADPWNTEGVLKIVKKDATIKIYWRDEFITSGSYKNLENLVELKFNLRSGNNVTNIVVKN